MKTKKLFSILAAGAILTQSVVFKTVEAGILDDIIERSYFRRYLLNQLEASSTEEEWLKKSRPEVLESYVSDFRVDIERRRDTVSFCYYRCAAAAETEAKKRYSSVRPRPRYPDSQEIKRFCYENFCITTAAKDLFDDWFKRTKKNAGCSITISDDKFLRAIPPLVFFLDVPDALIADRAKIWGCSHADLAYALGKKFFEAKHPAKKIDCSQPDVSKILNIAGLLHDVLGPVSVDDLADNVALLTSTDISEELIRQVIHAYPPMWRDKPCADDREAVYKLMNIVHTYLPCAKRPEQTALRRSDVLETFILKHFPYISKDHMKIYIAQAWKRVCNFTMEKRDSQEIAARERTKKMDDLLRETDDMITEFDSVTGFPF
jgi:hypothetical protein